MTRRELEIWRSLGEHSNVCRFVTSTEISEAKNHQGPTDKFCYILCEYCEGSLVQYLVTHANKLSEREIVDCALQILVGIEHMHKMKVCHRDIKVENILYKTNKGNYTFKLCDFGSATKDHSINYSEASKQ